MIIAVTSMGDTLDDQMAFRLGRSAYYLIINTEDLDVEAIENPDLSSDEDVSVQCVRLMANRGVQVVVTGHCGPEVHHSYSVAGIRVISGVSGSVMDAVEQLKTQEENPAEQNDLEERLSEANAPLPGAVTSSAGTPAVSYEDYLQIRAEVVVLQRKLLELHRRVIQLEKRHG